jgi:hypothetical protein
MLTAIPGAPPGWAVSNDICSGMPIEAGRNTGSEHLADMRDNGRDVSQDNGRDNGQDNGQDNGMVRTLQAIGR